MLNQENKIHTKAVILAGSSGIQLSSIAKESPRYLFPIRGRPIIEHIVDKLQSLDEIEEVYIISNLRFFKQFRNWLDNYSSTISIKIINNGSLNGKDSSCAVKDLSRVIKDQASGADLLVLGGDNLFDFSLDEFIERAKSSRPHPFIGTYHLNGRYKSKRYGVVKVNETSKIIDFYEKPPSLGDSHIISLCLYYLPQEIVSSVDAYLNIYPANGSIGNYIKWLIKGQEVYAYNFEGSWFDIGDLDAYTEALCIF